MNGSSDVAPGVVELREDVPLKAGAGGSAEAACCARGPRLIITCFAALTAAITLALFTQIYYGDYEIVPHGGVSSDAEACSGAGTDVLKAGGGAMDAAAAAALCLAVLAPHLTSLDASGSMLYWEYRQSRSQQPTLAEWGGSGSGSGGEAPRLLAALAALHAQHGALPWARVLQPAIHLAKNGFIVSEGLAAALADQAKAAVSKGALPLEATAAAGTLSTAPKLAAYLESLQRNSSAELSAAWNGAGTLLSTKSVFASAAGAWRIFAGGSASGALHVQRALAQALDPPPEDLDEAERRVISALQLEAMAGDGWPAAPSGVATGLAVVDSSDTYVALVTGLSVAFGSRPSSSSSVAMAEAGWTRDVPTAPLDLAPAILLDERVCGTRYVLGGGSGAALAQAAAALASGGGAGGADVERPRANVLAGGVLAVEAALLANALPAGAVLAEERVLTPTVNVVQQRADALLTHADSRGGGIASRF